MSNLDVGFTVPFVPAELEEHFCLSRPVSGTEIITMARQLLQIRVAQGVQLDSPNACCTFLTVELGHEQREVFYALYLDNQHRVLTSGVCFLGTIDSSTVHPRELVKQALAFNASAVIIAHNHPSGTLKPSNADIQITQRVKSALALVDVRLLDHVIVGGGYWSSMAEQGLL